MAMRRFLILAVLSALLAPACGDGDARSQPSTVPTESSTPIETPKPSPSPTTDAAEELDALLAGTESKVADELRAEGTARNCAAIHAFLSDAGLPVPDVNETCVEMDFDSDGDLEYGLLIVAPMEPGRPVIGDFVIFDEGADFEPVFRLPSIHADILGADRTRVLEPELRGAEDFNGDGFPEVVLTGRYRGAHTSSVSIFLGGFREGRYGPLLRPYENAPGGFMGVYQADNQIQFVDVSGDGAADLEVRQGIINSVGAGPQREATRTFLWDGERYTFAGLAWDPSNLRFFKVRDADDDFAAGNYEAAIPLYEEAISGLGLEDVQYFGSREELMAYSQFRVGLANAKLNRLDAAAVAIAAAIGGYPLSVHGGAAVQFRNASGLNGVNPGDLSAGCDAMIKSLQGSLDRFKAVWYYGYGNPEVTAESICPF